MASQKKSITFSDIAQYTGLSKATISRYFNQPSYLTQENIDIISKALKELKEDISVMAIGKHTPYTDTVETYIRENNLSGRVRILTHIPFNELERKPY